MDLRVIVLDVDGTLLTSDHEISADTRAAVGRARAAGVRVLLASARAPAGLRPILAALDLGGLVIAYTGALVCEIDGSAEPPVVRYERRIPLDSAAWIVDEATELGLEIGWHSGERWCAPAIGDGLRRESEIVGQPVELDRDPVSSGQAPHKLLCIAHRPAALPTLNALRRRLPADCAGHLSNHNYLEITAEGVNKAAAVERALAELAVRPDQLAAVGDGENDVALLRFAGTGVAMGHAIPYVRGAADWITDTNDRNGVAVAIDQLLADARLRHVRAIR